MKKMKLIMERWREYAKNQDSDFTEAVELIFNSDSLDDRNYKSRAYDMASHIIEASRVSGLPVGLLIAILKKESSMGVPPGGSKFVRSMKKGPMQITKIARKQRNSMRDLALSGDKDHWEWDYSSYDELPSDGGETIRDNIIAGAMHLRQELNNKGGNLRKALEAYNSEPGKSKSYAAAILSDYKKTIPAPDSRQKI
jgi:hypothetical protein